MVPGSFGCGSVVLAATATLAPSRAARSAIARPMPREAPLMKRVLPFRLMTFSFGAVGGMGMPPYVALITRADTTQTSVEFRKIRLALLEERSEGLLGLRRFEPLAERFALIAHGQLDRLVEA